MPGTRRPRRIRAYETTVSDPEAEGPPRAGDGEPAAAPTKTVNKDRLATALRENLRRRKEQRGARRAAALESAARAKASDDANSTDEPESEK